MFVRTFRAAHRAFIFLLDRTLLGLETGEGTEVRHPRATTASVNFRAAVMVALCLGFVGAGLSYVQSAKFPPVVYNTFGYGEDEKSGPITGNLLFDADVPMRVILMSDRFAPQHAYSAEHPLLSMFIFFPVRGLEAAGLEKIQAIRVFVAFTCALWTALLFSLLTLWGCRLVDAAVFTVLGLVSAASLFWFSVPESFGLGSATIIAALILSLWPAPVSPILRYTAAMTLSLSMTVTNAMAGIFAAARRLPTRQLWIAGTSALFIVTMVWAVQKMIFPAAEFFIPPRTAWAEKFLFLPTPTRIAQVLQALFVHSMVMPDIDLLSSAQLHRPGTADRMMSVQRSLLGSGGLFGVIATVVWLALAALGAWAAATARSGLSILCLIILAGQVALHTLFGSETFLYVLHVVPLVVVVAAGVTFTRLRLVGLGLACAMIVFAGANNWTQFQKAVVMAEDLDAYARTFPGAQTPALLYPKP